MFSLDFKYFLVKYILIARFYRFLAKGSKSLDLSGSVCLFQLLSSAKNDRKALKYPSKWQWCEEVDVLAVNFTQTRKSFFVGPTLAPE